MDRLVMDVNDLSELKENPFADQLIDDLASKARGIVERGGEVIVKTVTGTVGTFSTAEGFDRFWNSFFA